MFQHVQQEESGQIDENYLLSLVVPLLITIIKKKWDFIDMFQHVQQEESGQIDENYLLSLVVPLHCIGCLYLKTLFFLKVISCNISKVLKNIYIYI